MVSVKILAECKSPDMPYLQWRRYTRARQWLEDPPPWLRPAYGFALVIVRTESKNVTMSDCFICFTLTAALAACVLRAMTKKGCQLFLRKKCIR